MMFCWISVLMLSNCKTPYVIPVNPSTTNLLVVEGYIDGAAPVTIKLSRTRVISNNDTAGYKFELGANITIEDNQQNRYPVPEVGNGVYTNPNILSLNPAYQYRLDIHTSDGKEYASYFVPFEQSPPIDNIGWNFKNNGVQIYLNTHGPNSASKYYRWAYTETWEVQSYFSATVQYNPGDNSVSPITNQLDSCWPSDISASILLGSSAALSSNVINQGPLTYIEPQDPRLSILYSIFVQQYALDLNGNNYWTALQNNTQNIGSLFDPQPNETNGNLYCVSDSEIVIGYMGAGNSSQKRIFISNSSMPAGWNPAPQCQIKIVPNIPDTLEADFLGPYAPIFPIYEGLTITSYESSYYGCVNCTLYGTNIKPDFWP